MADRSTLLIRDALARAAADPPDAPLFKGKSDDGLFPATPLGRAAADRAKADGLLATTRTDAAGKQPREWCGLTDKGRAWLLDHADPRPVLEDLVRVLEARQSAVGELAQAARRLQAGLDGLATVVRGVLPRLAGADEPADCGEDVVALLAGRAGVAGEDCPLPELYRRLCAARPGLTIGTFHDTLRRLHDDDRVYLHPWTGPLYDLPEPALALLVGHEIAYYASCRRDEPLAAAGRVPPATAGGLCTH